VTIKMSGHRPFPAQVILSGHQYAAAGGRAVWSAGGEPPATAMIRWSIA